MVNVELPTLISTRASRDLPMLNSSRKARHSAKSNAVFPEPTGLNGAAKFELDCFAAPQQQTYPPIPMVKARSSKSLFEKSGMLRSEYLPRDPDSNQLFFEAPSFARYLLPRHLPGFSKCSCV